MDHVQDLPPDERLTLTEPAVDQTTTADSLAVAREASQYTYAARATEDPAKLAKAVRIVRVALERKRLTLAEVLPADKAAA